MVGVPHTPGTREYLTCERGRIELTAAAEKWVLDAGDVLVFRGGQRHTYRNLDAAVPAVAISVVCFAASRGRRAGPPLLAPRQVLDVPQASVVEIELDREAAPATVVDQLIGRR